VLTTRNLIPSEKSPQMIFQRRLGLVVGAVFLFLVLFHVQSVGFKALQPGAGAVIPTTDPQYGQYRSQDKDQIAGQDGQATDSSPSAPGDSAVSPDAASSAPLKGTEQAPTSPKADGELSRMIVIASTRDEDTSWIQRELPGVETAIYVVDDPNAHYKVPKNKGHESMVYLTYMIDHYDKLPDVMVFLHAHQTAWHNNDLLGSDAARMIKSLSSPYVLRHGYVNARCHWDPGCPDWMHPFDPSNRTDISKPEERELAAAFAEIFPGRPIPETMATPCCAQFALSKEAVRRVPLDELQRYRDWILKTPLHDVISGRVWEYLWHYVFANSPVVCQRMDICYCDGFGICFGGEKIFNEYMNVRNDWRRLRMSLDGWEKETTDNKKHLTEAETWVRTELKRNIDKTSKELEARIKVAAERGKSPEFRAQDSGRTWKEGDGY
jgi:hypothetical protein